MACQQFRMITDEPMICQHYAKLAILRSYEVNADVKLYVQLRAQQVTQQLLYQVCATSYG